MPRKYPRETKQQAVGLLQIHNDISFTHFATGVHERTLRRWRDELRNKQNEFMSEKSFHSDIKRTQKQIPADNNNAESRQDDPADAVPPADTATTDLENFTFIRAQLMKYARQVAADLRPGEADSNRRTLALSRILDRIDRLDQVLPEIAKQQARPPWQDDYESLLELELPPWDMIKIEETASQFDEHLRGRVYRYYAEEHRKKATAPSRPADILRSTLSNQR